MRLETWMEAYEFWCPGCQKVNPKNERNQNAVCLVCGCDVELWKKDELPRPDRPPEDSP